MAQALQWEITVNEKLCKKCNLCVAYCPRNVLTGTGGPEITKPEACTGCLQCEMHCPDFAITVGRRDAE